MKRYTMLLLPLLASFSSASAQIIIGPPIPIPQSTTYSYDACGNRIKVNSAFLSVLDVADESQENDGTPKHMAASKGTATDIVTLTLTGIDLSECWVSVCDPVGRLLMKKEALPSLDIDLSKQPEGCYIVSLEGREIKESIKITKQN